MAGIARLSKTEAFRTAAGLLAVLACASSAPARTAQKPAPKPALTAEIQDDGIIVRADGVTFTRYRYGPGQKYPYFYPVNGPLSGLSLTTESSLPYPHHRSLWFGCDRINGGDYWQEGNERGQIVSRGARIVAAGPDEIRLDDGCAWRQPGREAVIQDERTIVITAPSADLRVIDFEIVLQALADLRIEATNHSLFAARMAPELSPAKGGALTNAEGKSGEKGTAGVASDWMDASGTRFGLAEGLAIFDAPGNPWHPSRWFTRDYGFFSPTNLNWIGGDGFRMRKGETALFRYRVVAHSGNAARAGLAGLYERWIARPGR
jgi:hypothetical protein